MDWLAGFSLVLAIGPILAVIAGVAIGIVFGAVPGLSAAMAVALCLPITFGMDPMSAIALLVALYIGGVSGGLISAILIGIPGTPSSIATTFDGYPMACKGEAGKALGLGIFYSFMGGMAGIAVLLFLAPPLARIALKFGNYEYFAIAIFSLTLVSGLAGPSLLKGSIGALLGLLFATVGFSPTDAVPRYTLGLHSLDAGLSLLPVLLGLFAVADVLNYAFNRTKNEIARQISFKMPRFPGVSWAEFRDNLGNFSRSGAIGAAIGLLPGIGGSASNLLAYSATRNLSKSPNSFGKGAAEGLIASESANNAGVGAAIVPMMALGIPGDAVTAMLLGGLMIHGIQPGPMMFETNGDIAYAIFIALIIANALMLVMALAGLRVFAKILSAPRHYILSIVMVTCVVGAFAANNRMFDVYTLLFFGVLGFALLRMSIPLPPFILGFILGPVIETNLRSAMMSSRGSLLPFFERPISSIFLGLSVLYLVIALIARRRVARKLRNADHGTSA